MNTLVNDREIESALQTARFISEAGADGIIIQDLGLASAIRQYLPDIPLHASTQMAIHNLKGVEAAAEMGMTRAVLARELSFEQIKFITQNAPIETEVFVHGALCFCHSGQCYMSSLIGRRSGNRGMCAQPCRMQYSLGGRMDDHPMSLKDNCLVEYLQQLEDAGVACLKIEGRMKRPEYTAIVTKIYSKALKEHRQPSPEEMLELERAFSRQGFTQGYFNGDKQDMFGTRSEAPDKEAEKMFTLARKAYSDSEIRRVPVHFYTVAEKATPIKAIAFDDEGNKQTFEHLDTVQVNGADYVICIPYKEEEDDEVDEVLILKMEAADDDEGSILIPETDLEVLDKAYELFKERNAELFDFED
jgi:putative protease